MFVRSRRLQRSAIVGAGWWAGSRFGVVLSLCAAVVIVAARGAGEPRKHFVDPIPVLEFLTFSSFSKLVLQMKGDSATSRATVTPPGFVEADIAHDVELELHACAGRFRKGQDPQVRRYVSPCVALVAESSC